MLVGLERFVLVLQVGVNRRELQLVHAFAFRETDQAVQAGQCRLVDDAVEADTDFRRLFTQAAQAFQGALEHALAANVIVNLRQMAFEGDGDRLDAAFLEPLDVLVPQEQAVCIEVDLHALAADIGDEVEEVLAQHGFPAGDGHDPRSQPRRRIHHRAPLLE